MKILVSGYGNPGRQDDGLGVLLVDELDKWAGINGINNVDFDSDYQLNLEDSLQASEYDLIIYADAALKQPEPFRIIEVKPEKAVAFTTHSMTPGTVLALCGELYGKFPKTYIIKIKGYGWEVNETFTSEARNNLKKAVEYIKPYILNPKKFSEITL